MQPKALLFVRKVDKVLKVSNNFHFDLAHIDQWQITFLMPVSKEELDRINQIAQDYDYHIANIVEE